MKNAFAEMNAQAGLIGHNLMAKAIAEEDVATIKQFRQCAVELYDNVIEVVDTNPDYSTWYALFIKLNKESALNKLGTTGEFSRLVDTLTSIDAHDYYTSNVVPLFGQGKAQLVSERDVSIGYLDMLIDKLSK